eukprot:3936700-Rhodomonas_salina.1
MCVCVFGAVVDGDLIGGFSTSSRHLLHVLVLDPRCVDSVSGCTDSVSGCVDSVFGCVVSVSGSSMPSIYGCMGTIHGCAAATDALSAFMASTFIPAYGCSMAGGVLRVGPELHHRRAHRPPRHPPP